MRLNCGKAMVYQYSGDKSKINFETSEIQCYICKCFGHLCCVNYTDEGPREISCYICGQLGHSGWDAGEIIHTTDCCFNSYMPIRWSLVQVCNGFASGSGALC